MPIPEFLLGASISGHQVNGGLHDQWTVWEKTHAERFAREAYKRFGHLPNWPDIEELATDPANYISDSGILHWQQYKEDFGLLRKLGLNTLRFSIEWAELEPQEGQWDREAIDRYRAYFAELKKQGITPFVTLWHFTHPQWFELKGGFRKRKNLIYFQHYVTKVMQEFGDDLGQYLLILNEPSSYVGMSMLKLWPPGKRSPLTAYKVYCNMLRAHICASNAIKRLRPEMQLGSAFGLSAILPRRSRHPIDQITSRLADWIANRWFINRASTSLDFIGVNFYFTGYVRNFHEDTPALPRNDEGWYMEPSALKGVVMDIWQRYGKPLIITETGVADAKDQYREWWIRETLDATREARNSGADIRGYMYWSLFDNCEWAEGWWPKFGLISVDRAKPSMPRTIRPSAKTVHSAAKDVGLVQEL